MARWLGRAVEEQRCLPHLIGQKKTEEKIKENSFYFVIESYSVNEESFIV